MPLYEYQCEKCGQTFETIQKFSDEPLTVHEGCGGKVERLMSAPAFHLKGSGWYVTDYGKGNSGGASASNASSDGKSSDAPAGETKSTETKSDTATVAKESKPAKSDS
jgi:putative FmdB family regulatory protein